MSPSRRDLIEELARDLAPVSRPGRTGRSFALALVASWLFVVALTAATGPLRDGFVDQLRASPRFLAESLLGFAAGAALLSSGLLLGIPRPAALWRRCAPGALLLVAWIGAYVYGLADPALEPSMAGKREGCWLQTLVFGGPPLLLGLLLLRRLAPLNRALSGALLGAAAGAIPGLLMQFACMYVPEHILVAHVAPLFALAALGALLGPLVLRRL